MSDLEDIKNGFERRLDARRAQHQERTNQEAAQLREQLMREIKLPPLPDLSRRLETIVARWPVQPAISHVPSLVEMSSSGKLQELDQIFSQLFDLPAYYPTNRLAYPTVYCETLKDFFQAQVDALDRSPQQREQTLGWMVEAAESDARKSNGGGTFGYNLPGQGAYLNGWLMAYNTHLSPRQVLEQPELALRVYGTAIHEKLGHGFLSVYSTLGQVKTRMGLDGFELAQRFGRREADDPASRLGMRQHNLIYHASQLLEEGWSTWLQTFMGLTVLKAGKHPRYSIQKIIDAFETIPQNEPNRLETMGKLRTALAWVFENQDTSLEALLKAVRVLEANGDEFGDALGQPLRYAVGEMLMVQAAFNLGPKCLPYAALIAANVKLNPAELAISDLEELLSSDPRLNPDARLAAISRMGLAEKNNVHLLASEVSARLSFTPPAEIK